MQRRDQKMRRLLLKTRVPFQARTPRFCTRTEYRTSAPITNARYYEVLLRPPPPSLWWTGISCYFPLNPFGYPALIRRLSVAYPGVINPQFIFSPGCVISRFILRFCSVDRPVIFHGRPPLLRVAASSLGGRAPGSRTTEMRVMDEAVVMRAVKWGEVLCWEKEE